MSYAPIESIIAAVVPAVIPAVIAEVPEGPQGPQGSQGTPGDDGIDGLNGAQGAQGAQGAAGSNGAQGSQGAQGAAGSNGAQGATGPAPSGTGFVSVTDGVLDTPGPIPVLRSSISGSQTIPNGGIALFLDGTVFSNGASITFLGTAQALFVKQLQIR